MGLTLLAFVFEAYVIGVDYSNYFVYLLDSETLLWGVVAVVCLLLSFWLFYRFVCFVLAANWAFKAVGIVIFAASVAVEYGYQKALGRFSDKVDLETALAATREQQIAALMMYVNAWAVLPCLLLIAAAVMIRAEKKRDLRAFLLSFFPMVIAFAVFPAVVVQNSRRSQRTPLSARTSICS